MIFESFLSELAGRLRVDDLTPDESGRCLVTFDNTHEVELRQLDGSQVLLQSTLDAPPSNDFQAEQFFRTLLQRNLARLREQRDILAYDSERGRVVLYRIVPMSEMPTFVDALEEFVNTVETWASQDKLDASPMTPHGMMPPFSAIMP